MNLYTFIFEYKGGTYISQVEDDDITSAYYSWCNDIDYKKIEGMSKTRYKKIMEQKSDVRFLTLFDCRNIWCTGLHYGKLSQLTIVLTVNKTSSNE